MQPKNRKTWRQNTRRLSTQKKPDCPPNVAGWAKARLAWAEFLVETKFIRFDY